MSDSFKSGSHVVPLGTAKQSSNEWMGIDSRYSSGTVGSRETSAANKLGGDRKQGKMVGKRVSPGQNGNAGNNEGDSTESRYIGTSAKYENGSLGAREDKSFGKYGGSQKKGLGFVGKGGKGAPSESSGAKIYGGLKVQPGIDIVKGTGDLQGVARAWKGLGKGGSGRGPKE